jgi:hypothetical protein
MACNPIDALAPRCGTRLLRLNYRKNTYTNMMKASIYTSLHSQGLELFDGLGANPIPMKVCKPSTVHQPHACTFAAATSHLFCCACAVGRFEGLSQCNQIQAALASAHAPFYGTCHCSFLPATSSLLSLIPYPLLPTPTPLSCPALVHQAVCDAVDKALTAFRAPPRIVVGGQMTLALWIKWLLTDSAWDKFQDMVGGHVRSQAKRRREATSK